VAKSILGYLDIMVRRIAAEAKRRLSFNRPCCGRVTADERWLLDLLTRPRGPALFAASAEVLEAGAVAQVLDLAARLAGLVETGQLPEQPAGAGPADHAFVPLSYSLH
jgi:hypothetical protein